MPLIGVDMAVAANTPVAQNLTALEDMDAWLGEPAAFVMRYLTAGSDPSKPVAHPVTAAEIDYVVNTKRRGLGLIANATTAAGVAAGWQQGLKDAALHLAAAKALGVATDLSLVIWYDIEAYMAPIAAWIQAVVEATLQGGFLPGFYTAPSNQAFVDAYAQAMRNDTGNVNRSKLWIASWKTAPTSAHTAPVWNPGGAIAGTSPTAWQYAANLANIADEDEINTTLALSGLLVPPKAPPSPAPTPAPATPTSSALNGLVLLAAVQGQINREADKLAIPATFGGPAGSVGQEIVLDTGAFELMLDQQTATQLGLPNEGAMEVSGVTGSAAAYSSHVDITVGGLQFHQVPCIVNPEADFQLFGFKLFVDNNLALVANGTTGAVEIWGPPV